MQDGAEVLCPPRGGQHPWPGDQRGLVTNVLVVTAFKLGDPVMLLVEVISHDAARNHRQAADRGEPAIARSYSASTRGARTSQENCLAYAIPHD